MALSSDGAINVKGSLLFLYCSLGREEVHVYGTLTPEKVPLIQAFGFE